jgi:RNA recognition motif-containing protein
MAMEHHHNNDSQRGGNRGGRSERKRKSYPDDRDYDRDRDRDRDRSHRDHRDRDRSRDTRGDRDGGGGGGGSRRRSRSPNGPSGSRRRSTSPRWERGKKQKQKTQTDVPPERELFVGNIPSNIDERFLLNFLNGAMRHANLCNKQETPCTSCVINSGNFAFVEVLTSDLANKCLNLNGVLFLNTRIKVGRPKKYAGPFVIAKSWHELTGEVLTVDAVLGSEAEKVNRELFVGNTTPEMTDQMLVDFLGSAMEQVGLSVMEGNPISACEMFGKYAFIELRTPREAANALNLNNIPFMGSNLQVTRPSKFQGQWDKHSNWEHILAKFGMKPEEFELGKIISPAVIAAKPNLEPIDGENINVVKAELAQVRRALEIVNRQLDESNKKSEARKEQLVSLNKKWAEGKMELTELHKNRKESGNNSKRNVAEDMDTHIEKHEIKKKHDETSTILRGVTASLLQATQNLQEERKQRRELQKLMRESMNSGLNLNLKDKPETKHLSAFGASPLAIDFSSVRAEMQAMETETPGGEDNEPGAMEEDGSMTFQDLETPKAAAAAASFGGNTEAENDHDSSTPQMESLRAFLSNTPTTNIDWAAGASATPAEAPRSRDRAGVRLCRLLVHAPEMNGKDVSDIQEMAGKYNLGGYIKVGKPGLVVVEGLEFNCDIFMDNIVSQKKRFTKAGKVSERSSRAFPKEMSVIDGKTAMEDFAKACESVGLTDDLKKACA